MPTSNALRVCREVGKRLDRAYLDRGAVALGVQDLLERALRETGLEE